jgi:hypothetical protein
LFNGTFGSQIEFGDSQPGDSLRFSFFGEEAGFNNRFQVKESGASAFTTLFYNNDSRFADSTTDPLGLGSETFLTADLGFDGGILQFRFGIDTLATGASSTGTFATNGSNPDDSDGKALQNFFVVDVDHNENGVARNGVLLWLDDGGADNDGDHDDMVVFIEAIGRPGGPSNAPNTMVPEPSSLAMWAVICLSCTSVRPRRRRMDSRSNSWETDQGAPSRFPKIRTVTRIASVILGRVRRIDTCFTAR